MRHAYSVNSSVLWRGTVYRVTCLHLWPGIAGLYDLEEADVTDRAPLEQFNVSEIELQPVLGSEVE